MKIIQPVTTAELERYYKLRWKILRAPWKQPRGSERAADDADSTHLMVLDDDNALLGVGRLHFNGIREAQIRFMAIDIPHQRKGVGTRLLQALEDRASRTGLPALRWMHGKPRWGFTGNAATARRDRDIPYLIAWRMCACEGALGVVIADAIRSCSVCACADGKQVGHEYYFPGPITSSVSSISPLVSMRMPVMPGTRART